MFTITSNEECQKCGKRVHITFKSIEELNDWLQTDTQFYVINKSNVCKECHKLYGTERRIVLDKFHEEFFKKESHESK